MACFEPCLNQMVKDEGGYELHSIPGDNGGITYAGISRNSWPDWPGWPLIDLGDTASPKIKSMVYNFYKINFWDVIRCDDIPFQKVAFELFDFCVNAGVEPSVKIAQKIIGAKTDGAFGPKTFAKLNAAIFDDVTAELFLLKFNLRKIFHYKNICLGDRRRKKDVINSNLQFLCGWINRIEDGL